MSQRNNNQPSFLNKIFSKGYGHAGNNADGSTDLDKSLKTKKKQLLNNLLDLYDSYGNNYTYFKNLCLDGEEQSTPNAVLNGVQGLKSLITEIRYELQVLSRKYPYLVVVSNPEDAQNDEIKVFNSLYAIIKKSESVLEHVKETGLQQYGTPDSVSKNKKPYSSNNMSSQSVHQNKMFNKRVMRSMRDHSDTRSSSNINSYQPQTSNGSIKETSIPTYQQQKIIEKAREEKRNQRIQQKSYSDSSNGSNNKRVSSDVERKQTEPENDGLETLDPFADFAEEAFLKPERKSLSSRQSSTKLQASSPEISNTKLSTNKAISVSLQAAALAAQANVSSSTNLKPPPKKLVSTSAIKPVQPPKKIVVTDKEGLQAAETIESDVKTQKDILEEEILKSTPQIDFKMGKQIFQEILVARSSQRPLEWNDIIGLENCKQQLKETIVFPFLRPDLFSGLREPINGLLLYGPPGTGKTMLAKCVAYQTESTFFNVSVSSITSKFLGESEKLVKGVFTLAAKLSPSIIFIDEIDSILGSRGSAGSGGDESGAAGESSRRFKNEFLTQWSNLSYSLAEDGSFNRVLVLGCTNLPWVIDDAARRRFQKRIYCPLPNFQDRINLIKMLLEKNDDKIVEFTTSELEELALLTEGFSNSDLLTLCKDASMEPIRDLIRKGDNSILNVDKGNIRSVNLEDFKTSINGNRIKGSVNLNTIQSYDDWTNQFGS
ncbi:hypothetical protein QEN19_002127 [Hanseniaspora menglaensis]